MIKADIKNIIKLFSIPTMLLLLYATLQLAWKAFDLPPKTEVFNSLAGFINEYGLALIFLAAIIEGLLLIGNYFPGGAVIFLGVVAAGGNVPKTIYVVAIVTLAFSISYTLNYTLGKYGWYKLFSKFGLQTTLDSMKKKLAKHVFYAMLSTYWFPNLAALCSTAAGIMHVPFRKFFLQSTIALIVWNTFWGIFAYFTGDAIITLNIWYILMIFCVWCGLILLKVFVYDKKFGVEITEK